MAVSDNRQLDQPIVMRAARGRRIAPSLAEDRQLELWNAAGMTGKLAENSALFTLLNTHK